MDGNTSYFHAKVKERKHRGRILSIQTSEGEVLTEESRIQNEFVQFYMDLFGTEEQAAPLDVEVVRKGRISTNEESTSHCRSFTEAEVKEAVFQIHNDKVPGHDGFSSYFYMVAWEIVGDDLTRAVLDFFHSGKILQKINATNVVLVPKDM